MGALGTTGRLLGPGFGGVVGGLMAAFGGVVGGAFATGLATTVGGTMDGACTGPASWGFTPLCGMGGTGISRAGTGAKTMFLDVRTWHVS